MSERRARVWLGRQRPGRADDGSLLTAALVSDPDLGRGGSEPGMGVSTVCAVRARAGLNRLSWREPPEPANRYCRRYGGELIHLDIKTLGRFRKVGKRALGHVPGRTSAGAGWEAVHVAVDDATGLAYVGVLPNQTAAVTVEFLQRASPGSPKRHHRPRSHDRQQIGLRLRTLERDLRGPRLRPIRTRPYRPRTKGKAERFIPTLLREWAAAAGYTPATTAERPCPTGSTIFSHQRPHGCLGHKAPITALAAA